MVPDPTILLTVDVEDWFQVENFKSVIPFESWPNRELRVERNVHTILDLLDIVKLNSQGVRREAQGDLALKPSFTPSRPHALAPNDSPKATFFILGWLAERLPHLVREIHARGHEVASHGFNHRLCNQCTPNELIEDLTKSKNLLEELIGRPVNGFRAPSFGIGDDMLKMVQEAGYLYDSSYNSSTLNSRYGKIILPKNGETGLAHKLDDRFYELPISNLTWKGRVIPLGGGGYFRLLPLKFFLKGVKKILKEKGVYLFYFHPWEIDPSQPKVKDAPWNFRFRHYCNLKKTYFRLRNLIEGFKACRFLTCVQYLREYNQSSV